MSEESREQFAHELAQRVMKAMMLSDITGAPLPSDKDAGEFFGVMCASLERLDMFEVLAKDGGVDADTLLSLIATMIAGLLMRASKDMAAAENTLPNGMTIEELTRYRPKPGERPN